MSDTLVLLVVITTYEDMINLKQIESRRGLKNVYFL